MGKLDKWVNSFLRSCITKKAYPSDKMAKEVAEKVFKERGVKLYCYYCNQCCRYHLTKRPPKDDKEKRERLF